MFLQLALLLHQELNSSPRVPRVPRVRHAGSLPLASPSATSMLIKRSSSSGGKDQSSVSSRFPDLLMIGYCLTEVYSLLIISSFEHTRIKGYGGRFLVCLL